MQHYCKECIEINLNLGHECSPAVDVETENSAGYLKEAEKAIFDSLEAKMKAIVEQNKKLNAELKKL